MKIAFATDEVRLICSDSKKATRALGAQAVAKLQRRLAELAAASVLDDLAYGRPHPLLGNRAGQFALDLSGGIRLIFKPTRQPPPLRTDASIDRTQISAITIIEIGDYHD